jgi:NAD-dependent SIR2 family protein deacetylase
VVFFGESVPKERVHQAMRRVDEADLLLVAGTSLMVWSGYRFVKRARERGTDVLAVNLGRTRADGEISFKIEADAGETLARVAASLLVESAPPSGVSSGRLGTGEPNALLLDRYS